MIRLSMTMTNPWHSDGYPLARGDWCNSQQSHCDSPLCNSLHLVPLAYRDVVLNLS